MSNLDRTGATTNERLFRFSAVAHHIYEQPAALPLGNARLPSFAFVKAAGWKRSLGRRGFGKFIGRLEEPHIWCECLRRMTAFQPNRDTDNLALWKSEPQAAHEHT